MPAREIICGAEGRLFLYGPFKRDGKHTSVSNAVFDSSLRDGNPEWGVRDIADLEALAAAAGLALSEIAEMPANNLILVFGRPNRPERRCMARVCLHRLIGRAVRFIVPQNQSIPRPFGRMRRNYPMIDVTAAHEISDDARARSNVRRLAAAQALTGANSAVIFATGSIVGATLAPDMSLATVPLSMYVVGLAAGTLPTGAISRAYGRRVAFIIGTACGVLTGLLASYRHPARVVRAVLLRDLPRRALWRGVAILSLRRRRRRQRRNIARKPCRG